jgi:hypothetical protein
MHSEVEVQEDDRVSLDVVEFGAQEDRAGQSHQLTRRHGGDQGECERCKYRKPGLTEKEYGYKNSRPANPDRPVTEV